MQIIYLKKLQRRTKFSPIMRKKWPMINMDILHQELAVDMILMAILVTFLVMSLAIFLVVPEIKVDLDLCEGQICNII